jgi:hypothetical protein
MDDRGAEVSPECEHSHSTGILGESCERCGQPALKRRPWARYCSNRCRAAANRKKQAEKVRRMEALIGELAELTGPPER